MNAAIKILDYKTVTKGIVNKSAVYPERLQKWLG
jgi:hypothetical protein